MRKTATWVLTDTRECCFHTFTCSGCGRIISVTKYFDSKGHYDMRSAVKELLEHYPYCNCGATMRSDTQIRAKMTQMKKTHKLAIDTCLSENPIKEKTYWKVDELLEII